LANAVVVAIAGDASTTIHARLAETHVNLFFAESSGEAFLAVALEIRVSQVLADTVVAAWEGLANTSLGQWTLN